jgi:hypothetical protein
MEEEALFMSGTGRNDLHGAPVPGRHCAHAIIVALLCLLPVNSQAQLIPRQLVHQDQVLALQLSEDFSPAMQGVLVEWLEHIATALLQVYGRWPRKRWEIIVTPVSASSANPIPWAQVHRGRVNRIEFYTARRATADQLKHTWTSYHEVSHLLIPYRGWGDMWFSEGLATYYQNVLQARTGIFDEQEMWQKLYAGFMRGRAQTEFDGVDLKTLSPNLRQHGGYMRVYWSGAWYFLAADVRLRRESNGKRNLDQALEKLNRCCADKKLSVVEMVRKLDELNGLNLFYPLYLAAIASTAVPEFEAIFTRLGITVGSGQRVKLQASGPEARLRREISARKDPVKAL